MRGKSRAAAFGAICLSTVAVTGLLYACGPANSETSPSPTAPAASQEEPTYQELVAMYPNEYNSSMTHKTDEEGEDNSHAGFQVLVETPAVRDGGGAILEVVDADDPRKSDIQIGCLSCKSSAIKEFYADEGYAIFAKDRVLSDQDMVDLDGRYWDCYGCHTWNGSGLDLAANMMYADEDVFPTLASFYDSLAPKEAVCGQCHNLAGARNNANSTEQAQNYTIYANGCSTDALFEQSWATATRDEEAGVWQAWVNHPQIETFQGSIHQSMGLGCVDCHMPMVTDENGNEYRQHNASGSVYDNDAAMEFCLTCHTDQSGIKTIDEMRAFLKGEQDAQKEHHLALKANLETLYDMLAEQTANQTVSEEVLEQCRENYSRAFYYMEMQQGNRFDPIDGAEIAHDPAEFKQLLNRADELVEQSKQLLAA